jgi:membrane protease YdiL (CAAX protease family)
MGKLFEWLKKEPGNRATLFLIFACLVIEVLYRYNIDSYLISRHLIAPLGAKHKIPILTWHFPFFLLYAAACEELVFRLPLGFLAERWGASYKLLIGVILSSMLFGIIHGNPYHLLMQGVSGILYSMIFLKCGGSNRNYIKAFLSCIAAHFLYNIVATISHLINGVTSI